jgi:hypothetical protein
MRGGSALYFGRSFSICDQNWASALFCRVPVKKSFGGKFIKDNIM